MNPLPHFLVFSFPAMFFLAWSLGGAGWLLPGLYAFGMIPVVDQILGHNREDPPDDDKTAGWLHELPLRLWVPTQLATLAFALAWIRTADQSPFEWLGAAISMGLLTGGIGITAAHELIHRREALPKALGEVLMTAVSYPWFCVEHVLGHHLHVGTPRDPATSRSGETVYAFWFRSVFGGLRSAWDIETERVGRQGRGPLGLGDRRLRYALSLSVVYLGIFGLFGLEAVGFFALQGIIGFSLLEVINYVEHYGLRRREEGGRYERVRPEHSWNSDHRFTNWLLFNLQRHADHHANPTRPYGTLRTDAQGPQLPYGYPTMVLVALVPPLWFRLMDPRVAAVSASAPG